MDTKVNYAGVTKRVTAGAIDGIIDFVIETILCFVLINTFATVFQNNELGKGSLEMAADFLKSIPSLLVFIILTFPMIFEILMITRFSGTPGQLLCGMRIKDASTFKNVTIKQAVIRCIFRDIVAKTILLLVKDSFMWFAAILIAVIFAVFDKRKQFFHDKIAGTVVINYSFPS